MTTKKRTEHGLQHSAESKAALKILSGKLKEARKAAELKPEQLASKIGCSKQVIYHIENGDCFPSMPVYLAIVRVLKLQSPALFS